MLLTVAVILLVLWALALLAFRAAGGLIHREVAVANAGGPVRPFLEGRV